MQSAAVGMKAWRLRRLVGVAALVVCAVASLAGSPAQQRGDFIRVLQMNLCNSGAAGCYTGRAVAQAAARILTDAPDVVTLNEVCENDISALVEPMAHAHAGGSVISGFQPALSRRTGGVVRCRNGLPYGVGIVAHLAGEDQRFTTYGGPYPMQENRGEQRVWLCLDATDFLACTTHLADDTPSVALAQCEHLLTTAIPAARPPGSARPTIVGGDLNLSPAAAGRCVVAGYTRLDDGAVQDVISSNDLVVDSAGTIDMNGATDHPALFVVLRSRSTSDRSG
jgi:endonuclease/exonuclease/phosphatase family metal-dependent hydrolase